MYNAIIDFLWVLVHPPFWIQNSSYSEGMEEVLNEIMEKDYNLLIYGEHTIQFKEIPGMSIWNGNYPYAAYTIGNSGMAKRRTRARFNQFLGKKVIQYYREKEKE